MSAPHLTRQLLLEEKTQIADGAGGFDTVWTGLGQIWAELRPGTGRDVAGEEVTLASVGYRITVRGAAQGAPSRPRPGQRFRDGARVFSIVAVTEADAAGQFLTCFAREEIPA
ncbi:head-tail adaptor protein [Gemmobacter caeruleus]|uniref:head-tail adaptor protein n=1 Tax=Gemmobacter caeruleus TaxID=2595004 RepID=UPI0011EF4CF1|nr:head-tail adaptor protein [Gemmobacter caeruleus]